MSAKNPNNGATFTKGKPIRRASPAPNPEREAAQLLVDKLDASKHRRFHKLKKKFGILGALKRLEDKASD